MTIIKEIGTKKTARLEMRATTDFKETVMEHSKDNGVSVPDLILEAYKVCYYDLPRMAVRISRGADPEAELAHLRELRPNLEKAVRRTAIYGEAGGDVRTKE